MIVPSRPIRVGELLVPGQAVIVILEGDPAVTARVAVALRDMIPLVQQSWRPGSVPQRIGVMLRVVVPVNAAAIVQEITHAADLSPLLFALRTTDFGELPAAVLDETLDYVIQVVTFVPRVAGRLVDKWLGTGTGLAVVLGVVVVGGAAVLLLRGRT